MICRFSLIPTRIPADFVCVSVCVCVNWQADPKMYMESQKIKNSQDNLEEQSWGIYTTRC